MSKTIIAEDLTITGDLSSSATTVDIAGKVTGDINAKAVDILVGGTVQGNVKATSAQVRGTLSGTLKADDVELHTDARVEADVTAKQLESHKGARLKGKIAISGE